MGPDAWSSGGEPDRLRWQRLGELADAAVLTALMHSFGDLLYDVAFRRLGSWSAAEEAVRLVFTRIWHQAIG